SRDALRDRMVALGGAAVQGGLYVSPHLWHNDVLDEATRLGVADLVSTAVTDDLCVGGERDPRQIVLRLWPLEELAVDYDAFVKRYRSMRDRLERMTRQREQLADSAFLPGALAMAVAF